MISIQFLAQWAIRSSILILSGALLLWALRVKSSSVRLAVWTALLCVSLALPALTGVLPKLPLVMKQATPALVEVAIPIQASPAALQREPVAKLEAHFDWERAALIAYILVAFTLLLRLCVGLVLSLRLLRNSRATDIGVRESDSVTAPVTLGIMRPQIVLPVEWREWEAAKLNVVLAHERSHIQRHDPAVQLLSAIHRAVLWHSPLSWFLHRRMVRTAEEASDDAAVSITHDRALYAEVLLDFMQRGVRRASWIGVPMARYGKVEARIHRILDGTAVSRGLARWSIAAIIVLGAPVAYVVSAAQPQGAQQPPKTTVAASPQKGQNPSPAAPAPAQQARGLAYLNGLGTVTASATVVIKARVEGQLMSVGFDEGSPVQLGQLIASIDPRPYELRVTEAEGKLGEDQAQLTPALRVDRNKIPQVEIAQLDAKVKADQANVELANLQLAYASIRSPITGVAGLRMIDPGNFVRAGDVIVTITRLQPIAVMFSVPEDALQQVLAREREGAGVPVEAWNRDNTIRFATGRLTAVDNLIDSETGTAKLKAVFENKDARLFPNQFVNVRMLMSR